MNCFFLAVLLYAAGAAPSTLAQQRHTEAVSAPVRRALLEAQNRVRAEVHIAPMAWSDALAQYAQQWAESLAARHVFAHRTGLRYGENLYEIQGGPATPEQVVAAWASEAQNYDLRTNTCHGVCGHYTQLVWRSSERVGCGVARGQGVELWVCNYDPPGNIIGQRPY